MQVTLQKNLILIRVDFDTLHSTWIKHFLSHHAHEILFLPRAFLVFHNEGLNSHRNDFLKILSRKFAHQNDISQKFFLKSLQKLKHLPIKIQLIKREERQNISVSLEVKDSTSVSVTLERANSWLMYYLHSQLHQYIQISTSKYMLLNVKSMDAKSRLERALNRRHILHFDVAYNYNSTFMQELYADFAGFDTSYNETKKIEFVDSQTEHYYTVLECQIGASQNALKKSYKKLVKIYHPDSVYRESIDVVSDYTHKFQLLQEAYTALRIVS
jgi:DnaJ-domain-containing protein 1